LRTKPQAHGHGGDLDYPLTAARRRARLGSKPAFIHLKVAGPLSYDFDRVFSTNV
jgi:hypothetical protein